MAAFGTLLAGARLLWPNPPPERRASGGPAPFSHRLHAGELGIPCESCHGGAQSRAAGAPSAETCLDCHGSGGSDAPAVQLTRAQASGGDTGWRRVHVLPDYLTFDHRPHLQAGLACQRCHGEVQTMSVLSRSAMTNCLACHEDPHTAVPQDTRRCPACHL
jgi:hypothetical protein